MEKKQLNFDAPLLSVRKSTILGSSDGQQKKIVAKSPPIRPNSAAIRMPDLELEEVTKTCNVPFVWEQIPGTPKSDGIENLYVPTQPFSIPNLPPGRRSEHDTHNGYLEKYPLNDHSALIEILRECVYGNRVSDTESVDDAFSDAVDTFESMSLNCSISGLSDFEVNDTNPSGTFNVDKQTGEFMMDRFLPASKAAILETPQYVSKKRCVVSEQMFGPVVRSCIPLKQGLRSERLLLGDPYSSYEVHPESNCSSQGQKPVGRNEHDKCGKRAGKNSGFLPHLCSKNSSCLVNPLAIMKSNEPVPKSGTNDLTRFTRKAYSGPIDKNCRDQNNNRECHSGVLSRGLLRVDSKTHQPSRLSYSSASCNNRATVTNPKSSVSPCVSIPRAIGDKMVNSGQANWQDVRLSNEVETDDNLQAPLSLTLPKLPADSWLWQTMHHVYSRNPDRHFNHVVPFYAKNLGQKPPVSSTKWETIVKTSHLHRSNRSFSEELVRHISH